MAAGGLMKMPRSAMIVLLLHPAYEGGCTLRKPHPTTIHVGSCRTLPWRRFVHTPCIFPSLIPGIALFATFILWSSVSGSNSGVLGITACLFTSFCLPSPSFRCNISMDVMLVYSITFSVAVFSYWGYCPPAPLLFRGFCPG